MMLELGPDWERELWVTPYWLNFDLSDGGAYVTMFTKSYDRARRLARAALPSQSVIAIIAAFPDPSMDIKAERNGWSTGSGFEHLEEMGVPTDDALASWEGYCWPGDEGDEEAEPWLHRAVRLTWDQADILLWNQVAMDVGVRPQAPVKSKLVDLERGLSVDAYDDRGMTILSLTKEPTAALYNQFQSWLNEYRRDEMVKVFES